MTICNIGFVRKAENQSDRLKLHKSLIFNLAEILLKVYGKGLVCTVMYRGVVIGQYGRKW
jgi:hypothetical protein